MGLDFGVKHVGIALGLDAGLAEPLTSLENNQELFLKLRQMVELYQVEKIVLGYSKGEMARKTAVFGKKLESFLRLPVIYVDETLSSKEASNDRVWLGGKKKRKQALHQFAAAIIVQRFLEEN